MNQGGAGDDVGDDEKINDSIFKTLKITSIEGDEVSLKSALFPSNSSAEITICILLRHFGWFVPSTSTERKENKISLNNHL